MLWHRLRLPCNAASISADILGLINLCNNLFDLNSNGIAIAKTSFSAIIQYRIPQYECKTHNKIPQARNYLYLCSPGRSAFFKQTWLSRGMINWSIRTDTVDPIDPPNEEREKTAATEKRKERNGKIHVIRNRSPASGSEWLVSSFSRVVCFWMTLKIAFLIILTCQGVHRGRYTVSRRVCLHIYSAAYCTHIRP